MTRVSRLTFPLALVFLSAGKCGGDAPSDDSTVEGDADADGDSDTDGDTDSDGDTDLPDLTAQMEPDHCDTEVAGFENRSGATSYYLGALRRDGDSDWTGSETLYMWATAEWEARGGADCVAVWDLLGTTIGASGCASCDFGLSLNATLNVGATTCPSDFTEGAETWSGDYDVAEHEDGTIDVFFSSSGSPLGGGYINASGLNYLSDRTCAWF